MDPTEIKRKLEQWGIMEPMGFKLPNEGTYSYQTFKKVRQWAHKFKPTQSRNLVLQRVQTTSLYVAYYTVYSLLELNKLKSMAGLINLGDLISSPWSDRQSLEEDASILVHSADVIILEDFDFLMDKTQSRAVAHWIISSRIRSKKPVIMLLEGDVDNLSTLLGGSTLLKFTNQSLVIK